MKNKNDYQELLKDPKWISKRNQILSRDKNTCQFCGCQDRYMQVHHKRYIKGKKPWEYEDKDLITLCNRCHEGETQESRELYENFLYLRDNMRDFGFSDAVIATLLSRLGDFFELYECEEPVCREEITRIIDMAVFGAANYNDIKTLKKIGIEHNDYIENILPMFKDDYKNYKGGKNEQSNEG